MGLQIGFHIIRSPIKTSQRRVTIADERENEPYESRICRLSLVSPTQMLTTLSSVAEHKPCNNNKKFIAAILEAFR